MIVKAIPALGCFSVHRVHPFSCTTYQPHTFTHTRTHTPPHSLTNPIYQGPSRPLPQTDLATRPNSDPPMALSYHAPFSPSLFLTEQLALILTHPWPHRTTHPFLLFITERRVLFWLRILFHDFLSSKLDYSWITSQLVFPMNQLWEDLRHSPDGPDGRDGKEDRTIRGFHFLETFHSVFSGTYKGIHSLRTDQEV